MDGKQRDGNSRVVEAELQFGTDRIRYLRAGNGPLVLLLGVGQDGVEPGEGVRGAFHRLAEHHRVVAPVGPPPARRDEAERWIRSLVEGLGLRSPEVVADAALAPLLSRFVRRSGGVVGRVVFIPAGEAVERWVGPLPEGPQRG